MVLGGLNINYLDKHILIWQIDIPLKNEYSTYSILSSYRYEMEDKFKFTLHRFDGPITRYHLNGSITLYMQVRFLKFKHVLKFMESYGI